MDSGDIKVGMTIFVDGGTLKIKRLWQQPNGAHIYATGTFHAYPRDGKRGKNKTFGWHPNKRPTVFSV